VAQVTPSQRGKQGLAVPFGVNRRGGAALTRGEDQLKKLIAIGFSYKDSDNPFENPGISVEFALNDSDTKAQIYGYAKTYFKTLREQELADLERVEFQDGESEGELVAVIHYINLETGEPDEYTKVFRGR